MVARPVDQEFRGARLRLIETLRERGIKDLAVLRAFEQTPRHQFVPTGLRHRAYEDSALPIGNGQTISQPSIHARYLELLELNGRERVLEVGTGSGYQTVLLGHLVEQVFTIERIPALYQQAREAIQRSGVANVSMLLGDGTLGWREYAPYDAILVSAGAPSVPEPLLAQILPAATEPDDIRAANAWLAAGNNADDIDDQDWDPSVLALARFPTVLKMLADSASPGR